MGHVERMVQAPRDEQLALLKSKESFMSWQSILRGVGVYSGCTRCVDVCPVGRDYDAHLQGRAGGDRRADAGEGSAPGGDGGPARVGRRRPALSSFGALDRGTTRRIAHHFQLSQRSLPLSPA